MVLIMADMLEVSVFGVSTLNALALNPAASVGLGLRHAVFCNKSLDHAMWVVKNETLIGRICRFLPVDALRAD